MMKRHAQQKSRSEVGVAYLELAIILAILTPLMVTFAFAWLPNFSKRSNELMNALSSLGACLVDPINLYDFKAGQLVLKVDFQPIVQGVVQNCGQLAEGATACGFVYDNQGDNIFTFGLNETPDRLCSTINVKQCVGKDQIPPGLVLAFLLEDGEAECEYNPADDPAGENQRGDEAGSGNGGGNNSSVVS